MNKAVALAIRITADATGTADIFDQVGASARGMADDVDRAGDSAASGLDRVAGSAENMDDKAGRATGALGALSAGFELVGLGAYAEGLNQAAMATDFASGLAQSFTLITELESLAVARAKVVTVAHTIATKAQTAATKAAAVATRVLNLAMRANPIGLVITAVVLLVGLMVTLYAKNERFRAIVQAVMRSAREAVGWVVDKAGDLIDGIGRVVSFLRERVPAAFRTFREVATGVMDKVTAPFQRLWDLIVGIVDKIKAIDFPDAPGWLTRIVASADGAEVATAGAQRGITAAATTPTTTPGGRVSADGPVQIIIQGALDPDAVARQIEELLATRRRRVGAWA